VIRIDEVGRAAAVNYATSPTRRKRPNSYFLIQFVTRHYSRMRVTVRQQYAESLYFLEGRLADATIESNKKSGLIERFLTSGNEEIDVHVKNVTLEDLRQPPYRATVDFDKVFLSPATRTEARRETYIAHVVFVLDDKVDNAHSNQPTRLADHLLPRGPGIRELVSTSASAIGERKWHSSWQREAAHRPFDPRVDGERVGQETKPAR
jgi:hypothetical protein